MKALIVSSLSVFFASSVYAQDANYNTITTTSMDSNNPTSIRILGQNDPVGPISSRKISFEFSSAGKAQISAYRENSWGTSLQFLTSDDPDIGGTPSVRMHIHKTGNVGIGTTSPASRLSVVHGTGYGKIAAFSSALGDEHVGIGTESNGFSWVGTTSNHNFQLYANNEAKMSVMANGNVGIGKTNPAHKLDVIGQINVSGQSGGYTTGDIPKLSFGSADTEYSEFALPFGGPVEYKTFHGHVFKTYGGGSSAVERMRINIDGDVSIGTPDSKGYKLAVNGKVRAHEIKVETASWPDYVFAKDYQLPTLQETEKHIKDKGHLPGIPSAAEVKANGVDLGEMNAKLLQKIEELTLFIIEQNKKMEEVTTRLNQLEKNKSN